MHILFVATRKNSDPTERELYEMDLLNRILSRAFQPAAASERLQWHNPRAQTRTGQLRG